MSDLAAMHAALKAISEEAENLMGLHLEGEILEAGERIISIARYQIDIRTAVELKNFQP